MSSLARTGGVFRAAPPPAAAEPADGDEVVIIGQSVRATYHATGTMATIPALIDAAEQRAAEILAEAQAQAEALVREAEARAESVRQVAYEDGYQAGLASGMWQAEADVEALVNLARAACADGKAIRDQVASTSLALLAEAVAIATRRIAGEWYEADPARTAAICADALRAASGQEVLSLRVHSSVSDHVQAALGTAGSYVVPDDGVEIGGCVIDLAGGTIDATLDTRLSLLELGLRHATGGGE